MIDDLGKDRRLFGGNRIKTLERDNFQCQECGMTQEQHFILYKTGLAVHHIDEKGFGSKNKNNNMENLITLCFRCHKRGHENPDKKKINEFREKIVGWIVMLDSPGFKDTDAELVREEMLQLVNVSSSGAFQAIPEPKGDN